MPSTNSFFHFRGRFDFSPDRFEIGNPIIQNKIQADNFFLKKLYKLAENEFEGYYNFHLSYFLASHPKEEEAFFKHLYDVVVNRIKHFKRLDPFSKKYARALAPTRKLEAFLKFLKSVDQWHKSEPIETVIGDKDNQIDKLRQRIAELESQLKEATKFDAAEKVVIDKGGLPAFMNLIDQLQDLTLPNDNKLTRSQTQSPWYKMIAKYFMHGDKDISIDTARNYFPAKKADKPAKFIEIAEKDKLFKIVRKDDK
ncbi:MAG TPA: hypothetical protein VL442_15845 [Mucilaginibacter sp.]|jgi:hypothetical protein|nr:hypothetical protein [Mucilaginibacter sp.]